MLPMKHLCKAELEPDIDGRGRSHPDRNGIRREWIENTSMYILKQPFLIGRVYLKIIKEGVKMVSQCEHLSFCYRTS